MSDIRDGILVVGDCIIDRSIFCDAIGLSLETPTLKTKKNAEVCDPGGSANVAKNLVALENACTYLTVLSDGTHDLLDFWEDDLLTKKIFYENREDSIKTRYWVNRGDVSYKYLQINEGCQSPIKKTTESEIQTYLHENVKNFKCVLLVDYQGGIFHSSDFVQRLIQLCKDAGVTCICSSQKSSKASRHSWFSNSDMIVMNRDEALANAADLDLQSLKEKLSASICVTMGDAGAKMSLLQSDKEYSSPAVDTEVIDTCGAGDSFLACLSSQDWKNNPESSLKISNMWASLAVKEIGTTVPSIDDPDYIL